MRRFALGSLTLLLSATLLGCGDDQGPEALPSCADAGMLTVTVTREPLPIVSWTPACRAGLLLVNRSALRSSSPTESTWWIYSPNPARPSIRPGIRLGRTPEGTVTVAPYRGLTPDSAYVVAVGSQSGGDPRAGAAYTMTFMGFTSFVR